MIMWLLGGVFKIIPGLYGKTLDYMNDKAKIELGGFQAGTVADTARLQAYVAAQVETNRMKMISNGWWGAKLIILTAGWPCAIHMAAIMLDSLPFYLPLLMEKAHVVGSWGVPKPPAPYDKYQENIVLSFFIVMPAMPIVSAAAQWLGRKR